MKLLSALGLLAGGFLIVPKGVWVVVALWAVARIQPTLAVTLFGVWVLVERWL